MLRIDIRKFLREVDEAEQPISRIHALVQDAHNHRGVNTETTDIPSVLQIRNWLLATVLLFRCDYAILFNFVTHSGGDSFRRKSSRLSPQHCAQSQRLRGSDPRLPIPATTRTGSRRSPVLRSLRRLGARPLTQSL